MTTADYMRGYRARVGNERGTRTDRARAEATRRLIASHRDEYDRYLAEAKKDQGLTPTSDRTPT